MPLPGRRLLVLGALALTACESPEPLVQEAAFRLVTSTPAFLTGNGRPLLELPGYVRTDHDPNVVWTLETRKRAAVQLDFRSPDTVISVVGGAGRGPGEINIALAMDVSPAGQVWIADPGNAKVIGYQSGRVIAEFMVDHAPLGIAAPVDDEVWVGGDLMESLMVRYDKTGRRLGSVGNPARPGRAGFIQNQGVAVRGAGPCAVVWAYAFFSVVECFAADGSKVWSGSGPETIAPAHRANPTRMSRNDVFTYVDVAAAGDRIFALYVGRKAGPEGLTTNMAHVFAAVDGTFLGTLQLPRAAQFLAVRDSLITLLDDDPEPRLFQYRMAMGGER